MKYDLHTHTTFCDGKNTPEEMARAAYEKGFDVLGFSGHSHTPCDESYCMSAEDTAKYCERIAQIKREYAYKLDIYCGIEQDLYSDMPAAGYDFVIGSVHYVKKDGEVIPVDESAEILQDAAKRLYCGNILALAEDYFKNVRMLAQMDRCDIAGHFDLITKFNEKTPLFDESDERYVCAWQSAARALVDAKITVEINVGAMSRGYRKTPYPSLEQLKFIRELGGEVIFSGDCHNAEALGYAMDEANILAKTAGFSDLFAVHPLKRIKRR